MASIWKANKLPNGVHAFSGGQGGTPVVLLSGWPETVEAFTEVFPLISKHHPTWALDLPGLGESAPSKDGYDTSTVSTILEEAARSILTEPYHLVGHDVGCWVAWSWAAQFPTKVKSLTLMDAGIPGLTLPMSFPLPAPLNFKLWQFSFNALPDLPEILTQGRERALFDWLFDNKAVHPERITEARRALYAERYARPGGMSAGFAYYRAVPKSAAANVELSKSKLKVPVFTVGGKEGVGGMLLKSMETLAEDVKGTVIEDCGHYVMEEQPEKVAEELLGFFKRVS